MGSNYPPVVPPLGNAQENQLEADKFHWRKGSPGLR